MIRDTYNRVVGGSSRGSGGQSPDADEITVRSMTDSQSQILVFQIPGGMDDETADEYIEYIKQLRERSGMQSKILILPAEFNIDEVAN